jgi:hypothetical protein
MQEKKQQVWAPRESREEGKQKAQTESKRERKAKGTNKKQEKKGFKSCKRQKEEERAGWQSQARVNNTLKRAETATYKRVIQINFPTQLLGCFGLDTALIQVCSG